MPETTARFHHLPELPASRFQPKRFRTLTVGSHRVVLGVLRGERRRTRSGRLKLTVQAILHPRGEMVPGCRGCTLARQFYR